MRALSRQRRTRLVGGRLGQEHPRRPAEWQPAGQPVRTGSRPGCTRRSGRPRRAGSRDLFGTHVGRRAEKLTVDRHRGFAGVAQGQAEVHEASGAGRSSPRPPGAPRRLLGTLQQDVRRLHVAVDHAPAVGVVQGVGHLGDEFGRLAEARPRRRAAAPPGSRPAPAPRRCTASPRRGRRRGRRRCRGGAAGRRSGPRAGSAPPPRGRRTGRSAAA